MTPNNLPEQYDGRERRLNIARALYMMNGILIEFGEVSYKELLEQYPDAFRRFVNSLPELTEEERRNYKGPHTDPH